MANKYTQLLGRAIDKDLTPTEIREALKDIESDSDAEFLALATSSIISYARYFKKASDIRWARFNARVNNV